MKSTDKRMSEMNEQYPQIQSRRQIDAMLLVFVKIKMVPPKISGANKKSEPDVI